MDYAGTLDYIMYDYSELKYLAIYKTAHAPRLI